MRPSYIAIIRYLKPKDFFPQRIVYKNYKLKIQVTEGKDSYVGLKLFKGNKKVVDVKEGFISGKYVKAPKKYHSLLIEMGLATIMSDAYHNKRFFKWRG